MTEAAKHFAALKCYRSPTRKKLSKVGIALQEEAGLGRPEPGAADLPADETLPTAW